MKTNVFEKDEKLVAVVLNNKIISDLKLISVARGITLSALLRDIIDNYLAEDCSTEYYENLLSEKATNQWLKLKHKYRNESKEILQKRFKEFIDELRTFLINKGIDESNVICICESVKSEEKIGTQKQ